MSEHAGGAVPGSSRDVSVSVPLSHSSEALRTLGATASSSTADHDGSVDAIRQFMRSKSCYDILPESFRTIVLDNRLSIRSAMHAMQINGVVSAPLYSSATSQFAGMLTLTDAIHLIQYYYQTQLNYDDAAEDVEGVQLSRLREIEEQIDVPPPPLVSIHPDQSVHDACAALVRTHARRIPVIDQDEETGKDIIISVLTQYRVLKFIAINCYHNALRLTESIGDLGIGTYIASYGRGNPRIQPPRARARTRSRSVIRSPAGSADRDTFDHVAAEATFDEEITAWASPIAVATLETTVFDVVHMFSEQGISAVPIVDEWGRVINLYETVDIVELVRDSAYSNLDLTIREAIARRRPDYPGVFTCTPEDSLASVLDYVRTKRVHRMVIVEGGEVPPDLSIASSPASPPFAASESGKSSPMPGTPSRNPSRMPGRLLGFLTLSDVLRYLIGTSRSEFRGHEVEGLGFRPVARPLPTIPD